MNILFFDTETTGLWNFKADLSDPSQPSMLQLAALLYTEKAPGVFEEVASLSCIIKDGYDSISKGAQDVHGLSKEFTAKCGILLSEAMVAFNSLVTIADKVICHNYDFDSKLIAKASVQLLRSNPLAAKPSLCTMKAPKVIDFCALPSKWKPSEFKWPKLTELHEKLFGVSFADAHDALVDVTATKDCFFELLRKELIAC